MSSNEKKSATLGMPHGTAAHKLRKIIMFSLLCRLKENLCFKCGLSIDKVEDLSVEHKKPWEGISAELFWSLENIAFSHIGCNRPHRIPGPRIPVPDGMAWCSRCQAPRAIEEFFKHSVQSDGLDAYCKKCRKEKDTRQNHAKRISVEV